MMSTTGDVHFILENKPHVKAHAALYGMSLTKFINAAVREKTAADIARAPPRVIVAGPTEDMPDTERRRGRPPSAARVI